jgi:kumamolisin
MSGRVVLQDSHRPLEDGAERVSDVDPKTRVEVTVTLRGPQLTDLDGTEPTIDRGEFEDRYGAAPKDIARVERTLVGLGLTVEHASRAGRSMRVSGTAAAMEDVFHPGLGIYSSLGQRRFRGREGNLEIPEELKGLITGVFGFDERRMAYRASSVETSVSPAVAAADPLSPAGLEDHYDFPPGGVGGRRVGIAELGGTYFPSDLELFCEKYGLAVPQVTVVDAGWKPPAPGQLGQLSPEEQNEVLNDSGEVMMDIEIVAGLCPEADIFVYFGKFTQKGWIDLINKLIEEDPAVDVLSVSWGLAEDSAGWSKSALSEINLRLNAAARLGVTVCAAAGDDGSGDMAEDGFCHVNFPASSPYVLSVGGTMVDEQQEQVWWESPGQRFLPGGKGEPSGGGSTGGGISAVFSRPTWQTVDVERPKINGHPETGIDGRVVPDVAALAGRPLYELVFMGKVAPNGGTSAATPLWAALLTRIYAAGMPAGGPRFFAPLLYQNGPNGQPRGEEACCDITVGGNRSLPRPGVGYTAGPGYDAVSGWGVPDGQKLLASLPAPAAGSDAAKPLS